jgi:peptidyl-prolyl cis-trans isomerase C
VPHAHAAAEDVVLVRSPHVTMTKADYEAELLRLAPDLRGGFNASAKRVIDLLNAILVNRTLAAQALQNGFDKDPEVQQLIKSETARILARRQIRSIEETAGREFDAKGDMTATARERYLAFPDKYRQPERVSVSHIVFLTKQRTDDEARKLAEDARARALGAANFNQLATELSDEPAAKKSGGRIDFFGTADKIDPAFSKAAFALANVGDVSPPVKSSFGWHVIRLDGRQPAGQTPFDEVKSQIIGEMRQRYIDQQRESALAAIRNDPSIEVNQAAVDALSEHPSLSSPASRSSAPKSP